jgi:hypothetical protein
MFGRHLRDGQHYGKALVSKQARTPKRRTLPMKLSRAHRFPRDNASVGYLSWCIFTSRLVSKKRFRLISLPQSLQLNQGFLPQVPSDHLEGPPANVNTVSLQASLPLADPAAGGTPLMKAQSQQQGSRPSGRTICPSLQVHFIHKLLLHLSPLRPSVQLGIARSSSLLVLSRVLVWVT